MDFQFLNANKTEKSHYCDLEMFDCERKGSKAFERVANFSGRWKIRLKNILKPFKC